MKLKIKTKVYILRDARGHILTFCVKEGDENVGAYGYDKNGDYQSFDDDAWNLHEWADEHGMCVTSTATEFEVDVEMPQLYATGSTVKAWSEDCEVLGYNALDDLYELKASWGVGYEQPKYINLS